MSSSKTKGPNTKGSNVKIQKALFDRTRTQYRTAIATQMAPAMASIISLGATQIATAGGTNARPMVVIRSLELDIVGNPTLHQNAKSREVGLPETGNFSRT